MLDEDEISSPFSDILEEEFTFIDRSTPAPAPADADPLAAVLEAAMNTPMARQFFGQALDALDRVANAIDPSNPESSTKARRVVSRAAANEVRRRVSKNHQTRTPPPFTPHSAPPSAPHPVDIARRVMGFAAIEPLNRNLITKRRRELAMDRHPDHGGTTEDMQRLNKAAEILLAHHK